MRGNTSTGASTGQVTTGQINNVTPPDFVLNEVRLLLDKLAAPETNASFETPARADPGSIENSIRPPEVTWTWADSDAREHQNVSEVDIGKYGLQTDIHKLFKLASIAPILWQPVRDFSIATWTWRNEQERQSQPVSSGDVGKIGYQADIDSYFRLDNATGPVWKSVSNPNNSSAPFELSTGASDAVSYHDCYRLQIAFEDVWAELIDESIGTTAQAFYTKWDALMNEGMGSDFNDEQYTSEFDVSTSSIAGAKPLVVAMPALSVSNPQTLVTSRTTVLSLLTSSVAVIDQIGGKASPLFKNAFGLDLQNIRAELATALSRFSTFPSGPGADSKPITDPLDAALQIIVSLKSKLSQGAAARTAVFSAIPLDDIWGYDQLENFLNDVRVILGLPEVQAPSASTNAMENYQSYFATIFLDLRSALDYINSFVFAYETLQPQANPNQALSLSSQIPLNINQAIIDCNALLNDASASFKQRYTADFNNIIVNLENAEVRVQGLATAVTAGVTSQNVIKSNSQEISNILTPIKDAQTSLQSIIASYTAALQDQTGSTSATSDLNFPEIETLFKKLSDMLKERYRFDVFAPASINYGLLLNYRQQWKPQILPGRQSRRDHSVGARGDATVHKQDSGQEIEERQGDRRILAQQQGRQVRNAAQRRRDFQ